MPRSARLIRVDVLRRFLRCYAVAGNLLQIVMVIHIAILCSRTNDRTTCDTIALIHMEVDAPRRSSDVYLVNKQYSYLMFVDAR